MAIDLNQCNQECTGCIKGYIKKHTLESGQSFEIECDGIPKEFIPEDILATISKDEQDTALSVLDPVTWAANTLDWHCLDPDGSVWMRKNPKEYDDWREKNPDADILGHSRYHRPYQAIMLRCSARRKVFRIGRQCLAGNSKVLLANGSLKEIKNISINDQIVSSVNNKIIPSRVTGHWNSGKKTVYKIKTKFGHHITCTSDHRFLIANKYIDKYHNYTINDIPHKWLSIDSGLAKGSKIAVPLKTVHPESKYTNIPLATMLGYFLSDGTCTINQSAKFTNINMDYLLEFENLAKHFGTNVKWYKKGKGYDLVISNGQGKNNPLRNLLQDLGLTNITGSNKFIPDCIYKNAGKETVQAFIRTFWAGDGYVSTFRRTGRNSLRTEIGNLQESKKLIEQIQEILWRFGVHGYIKKEGNAYRYVVSNKISIENFLNEIGPIPGKEAACQKALDNLANIADSFSNVSDDLLWDYVSSIEEIGIQDTWDIEVAGPSNFIANGILTHNSGKTECLVISMLYNMFVKPHLPVEEGFKIVVITPYQAQIDLIFERLTQLISQSPVTQNSLKRHVKAPIYTLQLHNGSAVRGFTAGTKSGGNAESVRGQHGHMLVFDEADYLSSSDMDAALSIITNFPTATVWMSSTPSGKREKFFDTCIGREFKEYHFPSQVNPMWNDSLEKLFKSQLTEIGFKHEILAQFGEQEEGVFQNVYVQAARQKYKYGSFEVYNSWTYTMGVDWNDTKNGTTINVLGFNPANNKFIIVDRTVVSRDGWTQLAACQKIAELNRIWNPISIYLDRGFGGGQWEILRKYGADSLVDPTKGPTHPDAKLRDIVVQYDFGSKVETRDLFSKAPVQKEAKPFLVESTVRRFESGDIWFSADDEMLEKQLLGYVIDRITPTGRPVYKPIEEDTGDHALDALMLSVVAFVLETTPWGKPKYDTNIAFSGYFGEKEDQIFEGDTVIKGTSKKEIHREHRSRTRPTTGRDEELSGQMSLFNSQQLPGNHIKQESRVGTWQWDGFYRDEPKPRVRSLSEAASDAQKRIGLSPRRGGKPRRKTNW